MILFQERWFSFQAIAAARLFCAISSALLFLLGLVDDLAVALVVPVVDAAELPTRLQKSA